MAVPNALMPPPELAAATTPYLSDPTPFSPAERADYIIALWRDSTLSNTQRQGLLVGLDALYETLLAAFVMAAAHNAQSQTQVRSVLSLSRVVAATTPDWLSEKALMMLHTLSNGYPDTEMLLAPAFAAAEPYFAPETLKYCQPALSRPPTAEAATLVMLRHADKTAALDALRTLCEQQFVLGWAVDVAPAFALACDRFGLRAVMHEVVCLKPHIRPMLRGYARVREPDYPVLGQLADHV
jgi:hypothetical protein